MCENKKLETLKKDEINCHCGCFGFKEQTSHDLKNEKDIQIQDKHEMN